jgi:hypothetical protein
VNFKKAASSLTALHVVERCRQNMRQFRVNPRARDRWLTQMVNEGTCSCLTIAAVFRRPGCSARRAVRTAARSAAAPPLLFGRSARADELGVETVTAESLRVVERRAVYTHAATGAETQVLTILRHDRNRPLTLAEALDRGGEIARSCSSTSPAALPCRCPHRA